MCVCEREREKERDTHKHTHRKLLRNDWTTLQPNRGPVNPKNETHKEEMVTAMPFCTNT